MKRSKAIKLMYVTAAIVTVFLVSSLMIIAADSFTRDDNGNLIEIHENPNNPGEYMAVSLYRLGANNLAADNVNTALGLSLNKAIVITTATSAIQVNNW